MSAPGSRGVFISYRRQETSGLAGRLYERLAARLGDDQVFMDVDAIAPGLDFAEVITQAASSCPRPWCGWRGATRSACAMRASGLTLTGCWR
jgi:hypothetical protein